MRNATCWREETNFKGTDSSCPSIYFLFYDTVQFEIKFHSSIPANQSQENPIYPSINITLVNEVKNFRILAIEIPGGKRNLNMNINAQQAILNAYITNNSSLFKMYSANVSSLHRNIIRAI